MKYLKCFLVSILAIIGTFTFAACGKTNSDPLSDEYSADEILIAYFSCTDHTQGVAEHIESLTGGDLFEITPEEPYSSEDLNYNSGSSRTSQENSNDNARPAISNAVQDIENYKIVFLGYPIWFGKAPKIIYTFVETYSEKLDGTIIIPFCTSASSGIGNSAKNLHSLAASAEWKTGRRFESNAAQSSVESWLKDLNLKVAQN